MCINNYILLKKVVVKTYNYNWPIQSVDRPNRIQQFYLLGQGLQRNKNYGLMENNMHKHISDIVTTNHVKIPFE